MTMTIIYLILILATIYPLLLFLDYKSLRDPETGSYKSQYASDSLALFSPFAALYFHDFFWQALLYYFVPLHLYFVVLAWAVKRKVENFPPFEMIKVIGSGSFILTIIIYYLFFHQGLLTEPKAETPTETVQVVNHPWWVWWPFAGIVLSAWITALINSEKLILVLGLVLLILPYFSHHPLWAMLLTVFAMFWCCFSMAQKQGNSAYVAFLMFYLLAQTGSVVVYAIFF